jgi:hypothetical protein
MYPPRKELLEILHPAVALFSERTVSNPTVAVNNP